MKRNTTIATAITSLYTLFLIAPAAYAQILNGNLANDISSATGLSRTADPATTVAGVISAFLGILGLIAVIIILFAGFKWLTARGNEQAVTEAKDTLQTAVIGLIIILGSYGIALFVFSLIEDATGQGAVR